MEESNNITQRGDDNLQASISEGKSEILDDDDFNVTYINKIKTIADMNHSWFQFYTDFIYCCA